MLTKRAARLPLGWVVTAAALLAIGYAAGQYVATSPGSGTPPVPLPITYRVEIGELERSIDLRATVHWTVAGAVHATGTGVVTAMTPGPGILRAGDVVMRVDERPVVVLAAAVPSFRNLGPGSAGRDVSALNGFLANLGLAVDSSASDFGAATAAAVRRWQADLGVEPSGVVRAGDVLFIAPSGLGGRAFRWAAGVAIGTRIAAGSPLLEELAPPVLEIALGSTTPDGLVEGLTGTAALPDGRSVAVVLGPAIRDQTGLYVAPVTGRAGPVCDSATCPPPALTTPAMSIPVRFVIVPRTRGAIVPATVAQTDAAGQPFVTLADGSRRRIEVLVSVQGMMIVAGVEPGDEVVVP